MDERYALDCDPDNQKLLHLWQCYDNYNPQLWLVEVRTDGSLRILNNGTRLSLDIEGGAAQPDNLTDVITWQSHDGANQTWFLVEP